MANEIRQWQTTWKVYSFKNSEKEWKPELLSLIANYYNVKP